MTHDWTLHSEEPLFGGKKILVTWRCRGCMDYGRTVSVATDNPGVRESELAGGLADLRDRFGGELCATTTADKPNG